MADRPFSAAALMAQLEAPLPIDLLAPEPPYTLTAWGCGCNVVESKVTHACRKGEKCLRLHPPPDPLLAMRDSITALIGDAEAQIVRAGGEKAEEA